MPDIPDVKWNHADADAAARALQQAASELRRTAGDRNRAAQAATAEWRGKHRATFDEHLRKTLSAAEELARRYDEAARRINSASTEAREEQRRRKRKRQEQARR